MVVNTTSFHEWTAGRQRESGGLQLHRGVQILSLDGGSAAPYAPTQEIRNPSLVSPGAAAYTKYTVGNAWSTTFGTVAGKWWHAFGDGNGSVMWGYDGTQLKTSTDGVNFVPLGQRLIGSKVAGSSWQVPSTNVWYETDQSVTVPCSPGAAQWFEATGTLNFSGGQTVYISPGLDGSPTQSVWTYTFPSNQVVTYHARWYFTGLLGTHRFAVLIHSTAGTGGFWSSAAQTLFISEQRA